MNSKKHLIRGARKRIREIVGCSQPQVSNVLNGKQKGETALSRRIKFVAEHLEFEEPPARHRRLDLINSLPHGGQKRIARQAGCTPQKVSKVLNGHDAQTSYKAINIIRLAERYAERERARNKQR